MLGLLLVVGVLGAIYFIYAAATGGERVSEAKVEVVKGDTLSSVAEKLKQAGVIDSAFMFKMEARVGGYGTEIKTGEYTFAPDTDSDLILQKRTAGGDAPTEGIKLSEGLAIQEIARCVDGPHQFSLATCRGGGWAPPHG